MFYEVNYLYFYLKYIIFIRYHIKIILYIIKATPINS